MSMEGGRRGRECAYVSVRKRGERRRKTCLINITMDLWTTSLRMCGPHPCKSVLFANKLDSGISSTIPSPLRKRDRET